MAGLKESCIVILLIASLHFGESLKCFSCVSDLEIHSPKLKQSKLDLPEKICGALTLNNTDDLIDCGEGVSCIKLEISDATDENGATGSATFHTCGIMNANMCDGFKGETEDGSTIDCYNCDDADGCNSASSTAASLAVFFILALTAKIFS